MADTRHVPAERPTALHLFLIFSRIGLTSFGRGLSGWLLREFVRDRAWISEKDFLNGLSLAQALPGVNVTNMAIWIGHRLLGLRGAVASVAGIVLPPAVATVLLSAGFSSLQRFPATHWALDGGWPARLIAVASTAALTLARVDPLLAPGPACSWRCTEGEQERGAAVAR